MHVCPEQASKKKQKEEKEKSYFNVIIKQERKGKSQLVFNAPVLVDQLDFDYYIESFKQEENVLFSCIAIT